jgi:hypothetical protein
MICRYRNSSAIARIGHGVLSLDRTWRRAILKDTSIQKKNSQ